MKILRTCCLICTVGFASLSFAQDSRPSSSNNLKVFGTVNTIVPFDIKDEGIKFPVRWGVDVAWINEQNVRKGINHMGKENVTLVRGSFQTSKPLQDDSVLTSSHISTLNTRMRLANLVSDTAEIILNEDQEAGIDNYYCVNGKADAKHWASLINASVKWIQANYPKHPVVAVSPFNEPDYTSWGQGSRGDFKEIARILKEEYPRFKDIAITAGNTLNCDQALLWYEGVKPYVDWGNTHQLAGSFDTYAGFFKKVTDDGNYAYADELHNVGEAMVGAEYGMKAGVWWGFDSRARGEFCHISNHGSRIGYGESRNTWTSASVYRDDETGAVKAFLGSSERQATNASYLFVTSDREVYYDGQGPYRDFYMQIPGGTGYQKGQTNAERVIDIVYGEDVPPSVINGRYKIMNFATKGVVAEYGDANGHTNISQMTYNNRTNQQWDIVPVDSRIGGDYSFFKITSAADGKYMNVLNNSTSQANVIAFNANCASNEQWYFVYAGNGCYYIKNRESGLYLTLGSRSVAVGTNILQKKFGGSDRERELQMWRFLPLDVACELTAPAKPTGLTATAGNASIRLEWNANTEEDVDGYMIVRADEATGEWNTIARKLKDCYFVDNTCRQGVTYQYKVKAIDLAENQSEASDVVITKTTGEQGLIARWDYEDTLNDTTANWFDCIHVGKPNYIANHVSGSKSMNLSGSAYMRLPYEIADMDEMTISMWVNWQYTSLAWQRIFDFGNGTDQYMFLTPSNGNQMSFAIKNRGEEQTVNCKSRLQARAWKHVAVVIGKEKISVYVDGEEVGSNSDITIRPSDFRPSLNFIGKSQFVSDPIFRGYIDDVRIYNYPLTPEEIGSVMNDVVDGIAQKESEVGPVSYYNIGGVQQENPFRGLNIVKKKNGQSQKMIIK